MIREATKTDYNAIAHLQISSWRSAYRDILTEDFLGKPVYDEIMGRWTEHIPEANDVLLVHQGDYGVDGFINVLAETPALIDNLHISPRIYRNGTATALMRAAASRLIENGQNSARLKVITSNTPAAQFYLKLGGERGAEKHEHLYGQRVTTVEMTWRDLTGLARGV